MRILQVGFPQTDPPSVTVIMVPETDGDKCVIAELCDQPHAARCPDAANRPSAINGRILVSTLASELGLEKPGDPIQDPAHQPFLDNVCREMSLPAETLLGAAFVVRFFQW